MASADRNLVPALGSGQALLPHVVVDTAPGILWVFQGRVMRSSQRPPGPCGRWALGIPAGQGVRHPVTDLTPRFSHTVKAKPGEDADPAERAHADPRAGAQCPSQPGSHHPGTNPNVESSSRLKCKTNEIVSTRTWLFPARELQSGLCYSKRSPEPEPRLPPSSEGFEPESRRQA